MAERHRRGPRHGRDTDRDRSGSNTTTTDNYYLFYAGSDEGASTYGIGWASCPSVPTALCTDMSTSTAARHLPGHVRSRRPRRVHPAAHRDRPVSWSWPSPPGRAPRSATSAAASGPCTWPTSPSGLDGAPSLTADPAGGTDPGRQPDLPAAAAPPPGYWQVAADGGIFTFGSAAVLRLDRLHAGSTSPSSAWRRRPTTGATGSWPATAACSPTATPASTARRAASC